MTHPDILHMERTGETPGPDERGYIVKLICEIDVYQPHGTDDPEEESIDDLDHALTRMGAELVKRKVIGVERG